MALSLLIRNPLTWSSWWCEPTRFHLKLELATPPLRLIMPECVSEEITSFCPANRFCTSSQSKAPEQGTAPFFQIATSFLANRLSHSIRARLAAIALAANRRQASPPSRQGLLSGWL